MVTEKTSTWTRWIVPVVLILLSPIFLFPRIETVWFLFIPPLVFLVLRIKKKVDFQRTPLDWMIAILAFQVIVSGLVVADVNISLPKVTGFFFGIFLFYSLVFLLKSEKLLKMGIVIFLLGGTVLAVVGILGMSQQYEPKYFKLFFKLMKSLPSIQFGLPGAEQGFNPNAVAGGLTLVLPLCFVLFLPYMVRKKASLRIFFSGWWSLYFLASFFIMASVLLFTRSRSSFAGMFIVAWLLIFTGLRRKKIVVASITVIMLSVLIALFFLVGPIKLLHKDLDVRNKIWMPAVDQIKSHPVFGMGMNQARTIPPVGEKFGHFHNLFLHTAAELGIPALVAYVAILLGIALMCWKTWKTAAGDWIRNAVLGLGCGQLALFVFGVLDVIPLGAKVGFFFWLSLALIVVLYEQEKRKAADG